ncbi:hypothetical protein [Acinetobacter soli]|uniref:hypothetical protein n=1 Tax=Acinetobacter soli TaxID=487316 RepID=UPI00125066C6|nr:hypothetical protein [Acinetobacter soli]
MSHNHLLDRIYHKDNYNCVHFVNEAAMDLYGIDRSEALEPFMRAISNREFLPSKMRMLDFLPIPKEGCVVAFHPIDRNNGPHVGLYRMGKVLHIIDSGVHWMPIEVIKRMGFNRVSYYD